MDSNLGRIRLQIENSAPETSMLLATQGHLLVPLFNALQRDIEQQIQKLGMLGDDSEIGKAYRKLYNEAQIYKNLAVFAAECDVISKQSTHEVQS